MPQIKTDQLEFSLLFRCLARQVLKDHWGHKKRKQFYQRWATRHGSASTGRLIGLVKKEHESFLGYCALHSCVSSYSVYLDYLEHTHNSLLSSSSWMACPSQVADITPEHEQDAQESFSSKVAPWWSDLPHLAPTKGQGAKQ